MPPKHSPSEVTNRLSEHDDNVDGGVFASEPAFWFKSFHERLRSHSYGVEFIDVGAHDLTLEQECDYISFPAFALGTEKAAPHQLFTYVDKSFASKSKRSFTLVAGASVMLPALLEVHARLAQLEQQLEEQER